MTDSLRCHTHGVYTGHQGVQVCGLRGTACGRDGPADGCPNRKARQPVPGPWTWHTHKHKPNQRTEAEGKKTQVCPASQTRAICALDDRLDAASTHVPPRRSRTPSAASTAALGPITSVTDTVPNASASLLPCRRSTATKEAHLHATPELTTTCAHTHTHVHKSHTNMSR